jgi:hypothetical protein
MLTKVLPPRKTYFGFCLDSCDQIWCEERGSVKAMEGIAQERNTAHKQLKVLRNVQFL